MFPKVSWALKYFWTPSSKEIMVICNKVIEFWKSNPICILIKFKRLKPKGKRKCVAYKAKRGSPKFVTLLDYRFCKAVFSFSSSFLLLWKICVIYNFSLVDIGLSILTNRHARACAPILHTYEDWILWRLWPIDRSNDIFKGSVQGSNLPLHLKCIKKNTLWRLWTVILDNSCFPPPFWGNLCVKEKG